MLFRSQSDLKRTLLSQYKNHNLSHLAVSNERIADFDADRGKLTVYSITGEHQFNVDIKDIEHHWGIHILPDGCLLMGDHAYKKGKVKKYKLQAGTQQPIWCVNVDRPFGITTDQGFSAPKGLLNSAGTPYYLDYSHHTFKVKKSESPDVQFLIDDWNSDQTIYVENILLDYDYTLNYRSTQQGWTLPLYSDTHLTIQHLSKTAEHLYIGGQFTQDLNFNNAIFLGKENQSG